MGLLEDWSRVRDDRRVQQINRAYCAVVQQINRTYSASEVCARHDWAFGRCSEGQYWRAHRRLLKTQRIAKERAQQKRRHLLQYIGLVVRDDSD